MKKLETTFRKILKNTVRLHAYTILVIFVLYIFSILFSDLNDLFKSLPDIINGTLSKQEKGDLSVQILHGLAFTLILYKAFVVFLSYAKTLHINIKLIIELAIIAPIIELIFNFHGLTYAASIIYTAMAVFMSAIYLYFYETIQLTGQDHGE